MPAPAAPALVRPASVPTSLGNWAALACLAAFCMLPVLLAEIPAMVDYPNHLARMSILARAGTTLEHPLYQVVWAPYANLAMDMIVPPVARWIGVEAATKAFYLASQALIIGGAATLAAAAGGSALAASVIACLLLYATPFAFGFVNFEFALGLALFALASWIWLADHRLRLRLAVHAIAVVALYFAHLFALGIYGFAIGMIELWRLKQEAPPLRRTAILFLGMAVPAIAVAALAGVGGGAIGGAGTSWSAGAKLFWLGILNGWSREVSLALTLLLAIPLCLTFTRGRLRLVGPGPWLAAGFALLFLALPFRLFDTAFVDGRILVAALLILPAFAAAHFPRAQTARIFGAVLVLACLANAGFAIVVQLGYRAEYRALIAAIERIPSGSRLLPAGLGAEEDPPADLLDYPMYHAATLAVHTRDAFVPTLFTSPGKQPLRPHPSVQHLKLLEGAAIPWDLLQAYAGGAVPPDDLGYVRNWTRDFDYLLLVNPRGGALRSPLLEPVASGARFALYRVGPEAR